MPVKAFSLQWSFNEYQKLQASCEIGEMNHLYATLPFDEEKKYLLEITT